MFTLLLPCTWLGCEGQDTEGGWKEPSDKPASLLLYHSFPCQASLCWQREETEFKTKSAELFIPEIEQQMHCGLAED